MSEIVPQTYTAVPTITIAPDTPADLARLQANFDYSTPYIVNRNAATSAPYIPGRTLPYTSGMGEANPFVAPASRATPPAKPMNAPATPMTGMGGMVNAASGVLTALPSLGTALQNIATGVGNVGSILSGNQQNVQPLTSYNPYFARVMDDANRQNQQFLRDADEAWKIADRIPRDAPDPLGRAMQEGRRLACGILGIGCPETTPEGIPTNGSPGQLPPFTGGQSPGVLYAVTVPFNYQIGNITGGEAVAPPPYLLPGPIHGAIWKPFEDPNTSGYRILVQFGNPIQEAEWAGGSTSTGGIPVSVQIGTLQVTRYDGEPDTGGNPAPRPDAPYLPPRTPALMGSPPLSTYPSSPSTIPANPPNPATQPIDRPAINPLAPGNPPEVKPPDSDENSPLNPLNPLLPLLGLGLGAALLPGLLSRLRDAYNNKAKNLGSGNPTTPDPSSANCRFQPDTVSHSKLDLQYAFLQAMEANQTRLLNEVNTKLGNQLPNGGISAFLKKFFDMFNLDRILNILTFITAVHNAFMLSNAIGQTLFSAFDAGLQIFKVQLKDSEDNEISTSEWVGDAIENLFKSIFGDQTVESVQVFWRNANRIHQAAMNIVYSLQSVMDSLTSALEQIGNYVAKIGNAMKKFGVVTEKAYGWMNPNHNFHQGRFWNFLNRTQDAAEVAENIASNALNITEEVSNIQQQQNEFKDSVNAIEEQLNERESDAKKDSKSPSYSDADLNKPEE